MPTLSDRSADENYSPVANKNAEESFDDGAPDKSDTFVNKTENQRKTGKKIKL